MAYYTNPNLPKARAIAMQLLVVKQLPLLVVANKCGVYHSRVRRPNDNAHIERFNRTIQEECVGSTNPFSEELYGKVLSYLAYYNEERLHLGIQCKAPLEMLQRC